MKWLTDKPKFKKDCILLTAHKFNEETGWEYTLYTIQKTEGYNDNYEPSWYWGIFSEGGDEWGDLTDLKADLYCVLPMIKKSL